MEETIRKIVGEVVEERMATVMKAILIQKAVVDGAIELIGLMEEKIRSVEKELEVLDTVMTLIVEWVESQKKLMEQEKKGRMN